MLLSDAKKHIRYGYIAAIVPASFELVVFAIGEGGHRFARMDFLASALTLLALAYGIYRNSRACAILMFLACIPRALQNIFNPIWFILLIYYFNAIRGTFALARYSQRATTT